MTSVAARPARVLLADFVRDPSLDCTPWRRLPPRGACPPGFVSVGTWIRQRGPCRIGVTIVAARPARTGNRPAQFPTVGKIAGLTATWAL